MVVTIVCRDTINCKDTIVLCNGALDRLDFRFGTSTCITIKQGNLTTAKLIHVVFKLIFCLLYFSPKEYMKSNKSYTYVYMRSH